MTDATACFTTQCHEAGATPGYTFADHYVFSGTVYPQAIPITTGLQTKVIIITINITVFNQYPA